MGWRQDNECREITGDLSTDVPLPGAQHGAQDILDFRHLGFGSGRAKVQDGRGGVISQSPGCVASSSSAAGLGVEGQGLLSILVFRICVGIDFLLKGFHLPST